MQTEKAEKGKILKILTKKGKKKGKKKKKGEKKKKKKKREKKKKKKKIFPEKNRVFFFKNVLLLRGFQGSKKNFWSKIPWKILYFFGLHT